MGSNDASPVVSCDILGSGIVDDQSAVPSGKRESDLQAEVDVGAHILQPRVSDADILCETKNEMHYPTSSGHPTTLQQSNPNLENRCLSSTSLQYNPNKNNLALLLSQ